MNEIPHMPASSMNAVPTSGAHIVVPHSHFIPRMLLCQELETRFDPLSSTNYFDDNLYVSIVMFVVEHLVLNNWCQSLVPGYVIFGNQIPTLATCYCLKFKFLPFGIFPKQLMWEG